MDDKLRKLGLQGLLRFAVEQTKSEDAPESPEYKALDESEREFLENALKSMTYDVMEELSKALNVLENESATIEEKLESLDIIRDHIDNIDFANSFVKFGGTETLLKYLQVKEARNVAIYIVSEMAQNNPFCQTHFVTEKKLILRLIDIIKNEKNDDYSSALQALAALTRNFEPGLIEFLKYGGIKLLINCLQSNCSKVYIKTAFLIARLAAEQDSVRDEFVKQNAIASLIRNVDMVHGFDIKTETTLMAIEELLKSENWDSSTLNDKDEVKKLLLDIITTNEKLPECDEIVSYSKNILNKL